MTLLARYKTFVSVLNRVLALKFSLGLIIFCITYVGISAFGFYALWFTYGWWCVPIVAGATVVVYYTQRFFIDAIFI